VIVVDETAPDIRGGHGEQLNNKQCYNQVIIGKDKQMQPINLKFKTSPVPVVNSSEKSELIVIIKGRCGPKWQIGAWVIV
jgi:hypothetical protein